MKHKFCPIDLGKKWGNDVVCMICGKSKEKHEEKRRAFNLKSSIISHLRKIFFWSPLRKQALENAKVGNLYRCAVTKKKFPINEVSVDHIIPVVDTEKGWTNWDDFINRLFCDVTNLQVVSKVEHAKKTKAELKKRKKNKEK